MFGRRWFGLAVAVVLGAVLPTEGRAQIRIISQEALKEAATPTQIESVGVEIEGGRTIYLGVLQESDSPREFSIVWKNNSGRKAAITRIRSGCGCLVADYDSKPIASGKTGTIDLTFNPKGRSGQVRYNIYLYTTLADTNPSAVVEVVGSVESGDGHNPLWPHTMGTLQLRTREVTASDRVAKIAVRNGGSAPLVITHDARLSTRGIVARTEPRVLQPGQEGSLVVELPDEVVEKNEPLMLHLGGVNAPPRERKIEIRK